MNYDNLEEYVCGELKRYNELKDKMLETEKKQTEKLKGAVYEIEINKYRCHYEKDFEELQKVLDDYSHGLVGGAAFNYKNHFDELDSLGFELISYPYVTSFIYLGKEWIVYYNKGNFEIRELYRENIFTSKSFAEQRLIELAYKALDDHKALQAAKEIQE